MDTIFRQFLMHVHTPGFLRSRFPAPPSARHFYSGPGPGPPPLLVKARKKELQVDPKTAVCFVLDTSNTANNPRSSQMLLTGCIHTWSAVQYLLILASSTLLVSIL